MAKKKEEVIVIAKPNWKNLEISIVGETRLNIHRLGKKLQQEFTDRDQNKPKKKKGPRNLQAEFMDSMYYIDNSFQEVDTPEKIVKSTRFGFPASGFKKAMVSASRSYANLKMTEMRGRVFIMNQYVRIEGKPVMDEFWRRIGGKGPGTGTPDIGIRATFPEWKATLFVKYNADLISAESVVNLLATAGVSVGIGEDRPEKSGNTFGTWRIA